jgi:UDP-glucuronate 4-epimerase
MTVLVTGVAGFIGFHLARRLLESGYTVYGVDNLNDYYEVKLKQKRLALLQDYPQFAFDCLDICDRHALPERFAAHDFKYVIHLAAQAGIRYSIDNPYAYIDSNLVGFGNILETCRHYPVEHLIFASSSSVYGSNTKVPFAETDKSDRPISLYGATKKANELMAHAYSHLYQIPTTGLRFFTVYGPWGRPDMAYFKFVKAIAEDRPIDIYNHGRMWRDFTYIDDVVEGILRLLTYLPTDANHPPFKIYNIGNHSPVELLNFVEIIEQKLGKIAKKNWLPAQPGDVLATYADVESLYHAVGFSPATAIASGMANFIDWYQDYYGGAKS